MTWSNGDLATAATAGIALLALLRPDFERLSRRWRASIEMHPAGRVEVGFSNFGATIGLQGTLQAIRGDEFVSFGTVIIQRVADNLRHEFPWAVFRGTQFAAAQQAAFEIASGFLLSVAAPRRFNIQFHDAVTADALRQPLLDLQRLWTDYLQTQNIVLAEIPLTRSALSTMSSIKQICNKSHRYFKLSISTFTGLLEHTFLPSNFVQRGQQNRTGTIIHLRYRTARADSFD